MSSAVGETFSPYKNFGAVGPQKQMTYDASSSRIPSLESENAEQGQFTKAKGFPSLASSTFASTSREDRRVDSGFAAHIPDETLNQDPTGFANAVRTYVGANKKEPLRSLRPTGLPIFNRTNSSESSIDLASISDRQPPTSINAMNDSDTHQSFHGLSEPAATTETASSTWARIAAITTSSGEGTPRSNLTIALKQPAARKVISAKVLPVEPEASQQRVVWLTNLPKNFTTLDVSSQITQGALMSILLQTDAHESLPGLSACIIFMEATAASAFLSQNHYSTTRGVVSGPSVYSGITRTARGRIVAREDVERIEPLPGAPYKLDAALASMGPPAYARRRVKWSRARLFYDVSLQQFKRDVLNTVGGIQNVELFHFYNPGECTVVFASVEVAATCVAAFESWRTEKLEEGSVRSEKTGRSEGWGEKRDRSRSGPPSAECVGPGGVERQPLGHLDGKMGRYSGVEFGFVKDFNECPAKLYSQYGKDGKLRASSRMDGCEGLYEGPPV